MKRLVADAGPLLHLHEAGGLHLFPLIGEVAAPRAVLAEVRVHAPALWTAALPSWLKVISLSPTAAQRAAAWRGAGVLHAGEAEALAFAQENRPDWFITDDAAARLVAESLGIESHGSLGIVLWAAARNFIGKPEAEALLTGLEQSSLWLSPLVRKRAWAALADIFPAA
jgi:predicted nucleic acid-binding protein